MLLLPRPSGGNHKSRPLLCGWYVPTAFLTCIFVCWWYVNTAYSFEYFLCWWYVPTALLCVFLSVDGMFQQLFVYFMLMVRSNSIFMYIFYCWWYVPTASLCVFSLLMVCSNPFFMRIFSADGTFQLNLPTYSPCLSSYYFFCWLCFSGLLEFNDFNVEYDTK